MIRILIAEDMHMLRRALVALLDLEDDIEIVAELSSGAEIVPTAQALRPDVAVLDIDLPGTDGITAAQALHSALPECRTLILTSLGRPGNLRRALAAHASGFLLKDAEPDALSAAIRKVAAGERVIDPQLALAALDTGGSPLTERELEVLRMAADGEEPSQIASRLYLSAGTVRNYLTTVVTKLGARNRVDAIRIAREAGWL
ncbi:response regulator transcription factor [Streptomyces sp. PTM05]|uniref:Response regulator transcription factor n=1 Tax=Streptantibioticus parmotrematis TaxID=2873249 RepID=A0ABS7QUP2_9ACTN|nr:response regulator transcription factor [Streptantibioticus parmotrematis]MBY8886384.1 response regulator transcription factor [Streptantibioticus parmotrematis]